MFDVRATKHESRSVREQETNHCRLPARGFVSRSAAGAGQFRQRKGEEEEAQLSRERTRSTPLRTQTGASIPQAMQEMRQAPTSIDANYPSSSSGRSTE